MPYRRSPPLTRWLTERTTTIGVLAQGHAAVGIASGRGRPSIASKPLAHGYVIVMLREFQGFVRDLHDLAVAVLVASSGATAQFEPLLVKGLTKGRGMDRGNATGSTIKGDFSRLGVTPIDISSYNPNWNSPGTDSASFSALIELRNALGHGNETQLQSLIASGKANDSVSWARSRLPALNRYARALDHIVWDYLATTTGTDPW